VIWETVLALLPDELVKTLEASVLETRAGHAAIKAAVARMKCCQGLKLGEGRTRVWRDCPIMDSTVLERGRHTTFRAINDANRTPRQALPRANLSLLQG
jgi:hypothetical protein